VSGQSIVYKPLLFLLLLSSLFPLVVRQLVGHANKTDDQIDLWAGWREDCEEKVRCMKQYVIVWLSGRKTGGRETQMEISRDSKGENGGNVQVKVGVGMSRWTW
jgi:hypothetical protein